MKAEITGIVKLKSKYGGDFYYLFFRSKKKSFRMPVDPKNRNYKKWKDIIENSKEGEVCEGLKEKSPGILNADFKND